MKLILSDYLVVLVLTVLFSFGFVNRKKETATPKELIDLSGKVQSGDIVFRLGHGFISEAMRKFSLKDPRYSHTGIICIEEGKPFVYHLLGGESSKSFLQKESFENFCSRNEAASFGVYRTSLNDAQKKAVDSLNQFYFSTKLPYDNAFDLATDSAMYCTEYVYKVLSKAGGAKDILISSSMLSGHKYIACDDIYLNATLQKVFSFEYE